MPTDRQYLSEEERAVLERCEKATPGPWNVKTQTQWDEGFDFLDGEEGAFTFAIDAEPEDCKFIQHVRTDIPKLLDSLAAARRELAEAKLMITAWTQNNHHHDCAACDAVSRALVVPPSPVTHSEKESE